jgi:hypothetical protein
MGSHTPWVKQAHACTAQNRRGQASRKNRTLGAPSFSPYRSAASDTRRFAVSPFRPFAVSYRRFAHSPFRPFALSPFRRFALSPFRQFAILT